MKISSQNTLYLATLSFSIATPATATLLFYEPFDYAAGTEIEGSTPALGAESGWVDTSSGNGTPGGSPTDRSLTVRDVGTNGGDESGQTWTGIPSASAFPNTGGYLEGLRRDNNEGHITLGASVTSQFTDGSTIWVSYVSAPTTNSGNNNNHEPTLALGAGAFGGNEAGGNTGDDRGRILTDGGIGVYAPFNLSNSSLTAAYWDGATAGVNVNSSASTVTPPFTGTNTADFEQQLIIARIDFGATSDTITVNRFDLDASYVDLTAAEFDSGAVSITSAVNLDQSTFDTLAFDGVRTNLDEIRIATTFEESIGLTIPEPSSALLSLFGVGLVFIRRR